MDHLALNCESFILSCPLLLQTLTLTSIYFPSPQWSWLGVNLATYSSMPPSVGGPALAFLGCLAGFEFLFYEYWVRLRLPDLLLYGAALGLLTFIVGRQSLSGLIRMRKRREGLVNADKTS